MPTKSLNPLRERLLNRGLPRDYVDRAVAELEDHLADADVDDGPDRLGGEEQLADAFTREYRASSFAGRHPVLGVLSGVVLMHVLVIAYHLLVVLGLVGLAHVFGVAGTERRILAADLTSGEFVTLYVLFALGSFVPYVLVAASGARLVRGLGRGTGVALGVFALLVLLSALCTTDVRLAVGPDEQGAIFVGYGFPPPSFGGAPGSPLRQLLQPLVVACFGWLFCRRTFDARREPTLA